MNAILCRFENSSKESLYKNVLPLLGLEVIHEDDLSDGILPSPNSVIFLDAEEMSFNMMEDIRRLRSHTPGVSIVLTDYDPEGTYIYHEVWSMVDGVIPPDPTPEVIAEAAKMVLAGSSFLGYLGELNRRILNEKASSEFYKSLENLCDRPGYIRMIGSIVLSHLSENGEDIQHLARVGFISKLLARKIGLDPWFCSNIELAAPLHDIGMFDVSPSVISKSGQLTISDWDEISIHTIRGKEILSDPDCPVLEMASEICLSHHERWDSMGYPEGLGHGDIPTGGFIASVADSFDVMVSSRKYKDPLSIEEAFVEIQNNRGKQFSPICVYSLQSLRPLLVQLYTEVCGASPQG